MNKKKLSDFGGMTIPQTRNKSFDKESGACCFIAAVYATMYPEAFALYVKTNLDKYGYVPFSPLFAELKKEYPELSYKVEYKNRDECVLWPEIMYMNDTEELSFAQIAEELAKLGY